MRQKKLFSATSTTTNLIVRLILLSSHTGGRLQYYSDKLLYLYYCIVALNSQFPVFCMLHAGIKTENQ